MENKSISSNVLWRFGERFSAQIVSFIVSIVLARLLLPEDYGVVAIVSVFIEIANAFVVYGLGNALIQKKDADDLDFSSVLFFNVCFSIVLYLVLFFVSPLVADFYDNDLLIIVIRVLSIRVVLVSINSVQQAYVSKKMEFKKFFWSTLIGTVASGVIGIVLAFSGFGVWALVAQYLINAFLDTFILSFTIGWFPKFVYSWKRVGHLLKFGWKILFEGVSNIVSGQIRNLIIGKVYTSGDLGQYTRAQQFPQIIMTNINTSIGAVLFPAMSFVQDEDQKVVALMRKSIRISSYILFPILFGMAAVASNMVTVLLTDKWLDCVPYLYIFCFTSIISIGMQSRHQALKAKGRSDVFMFEHIISRILSLVVLLLVYRISVLAVALSGVIGTIILVLVTMYTSKKYTGYGYKEQVADIAGLTIMSVVMFVSSFLIGILININPIIELCIQIAVGIIVYLSFSMIFKPEGYIFVLDFIKHLFKKNKNEVKE